MAEPRTELTGASFTLSVLRLASTDLAHTAQYLEQKIAQSPNFFAFAPIIIDISHLDSLPDIGALDKMIREYRLIPVGVSGAKDAVSKTAVHEANLPNISSREYSGTKVPELPETRIHRGHIRSGVQIYAASTHLVVIGAVSPGAEVIADGDIHIYGPLRGRAIAGANGNGQAKIICNNLQPELVSIGGTYQLSDALPKNHWEKATLIRLENDQLHFDTLVN